MYPEEELVKQLKTKDQTAFTYLYNGYAPTLFGVISRYTKEKSNAEDMLQEVFCKIWQHMDSYDASKGRLFTWLMNITRNTAIDWKRNKNYKEGQKAFFDNSDLGSYCPYHFFEAKDIRKIVSSLSCQQRNIIELAYFYGFTQEQIARLLQLPLGTVKTRIRGARRHLRSLLADKNHSGV